MEYASQAAPNGGSSATIEVEEIDGFGARQRSQPHTGGNGKLLPVLRVEHLRKEYPAVSGGGPLVLFEDLSFDVNRGELVAVVGASGAGKSTLLHILAVLDRPTSGDVYCASIRLGKLDSRGASEFRNKEIGYVWQTHYLLPEFTALENAAMPLLARGMSRTVALRQAAEWLKEVGMQDRMHHRAGELSGGEQQRISLARALVTEPKLLLADEPTGNLDHRTADTVFRLIEDLHENHRLTSILVTHNTAFARRCSRILQLANGRLEEVSAQTLDERMYGPERPA